MDKDQITQHLRTACLLHSVEPVSAKLYSHHQVVYKHIKESVTWEEASPLKKQLWCYNNYAVTPKYNTQ
jgi:hypothetical protein